MAWIDVGAAADLKKTGKLVVRHEGRQILLLENAAGRFACLNRCPHEGYPLREGTITADAESCVLTCQWHNWKFDLVNGATLVGGDRLTRFSVRATGERIELDIVPEDPAASRQRHLTNLAGALTQADQQRIIRETARLLKTGATPGEILRHAFAWAHPRLEFGATHALGAAPDWLALAAAQGDDPEILLIALGEILGHLADDARDRTFYPYPDGIEEWDEKAFLAALEAQDEARAILTLRGGIAAGLTPYDWQRITARAALSHYADFGHALIYSVKTADLLHEIGPDAAAPLLEMLVRSLCLATREDLIPEFRLYAECRARWGEKLMAPPPLSVAALRSVTPRTILPLVTTWSAQHAPGAIFATLLDAAARQMLHADEKRFRATDNALADNVNWLDFTHALTFAQAGLQVVWEDPSLWPDLLLQLGCFVGRNAAYVDHDIDVTPYFVGDVDAFWPAQLDALLDHGRGRFIISSHLVKTLTAASQLAISHPELANRLAAALNRFLWADLKERHARRDARQMLRLVAEE
ncbi:Rieske (2Fe-2S) protein [Dongia sp.]|uniref:Rieske (2Fe-2S) protein n=1 Tax=Dongia sp. TaxID=1977262 RepID=UPI0035B0D390